MVDVLRAVPRGQTFGQRLNTGIGQGLNIAQQLYSQNQQQKQAQQQYEAENAAAKQMGLELAGIRDPKMRQEILSQHLKGQQLEREYGLKKGLESQSAMDRFNAEKELLKMKLEAESGKKAEKLSGENLEKIAPLQSGLQTVQQMRMLRKKGNLGRGSSIFGFFGGETAKDRGEYATLGNSLISLASTIPIRNKAEFETLTGKLNDPDITDSEADGVLNALERIINQNMQQYMGEYEPKQMSQNRSRKRPLESFLR